MVRQWSAKPSFPGSNPGGSSNQPGGNAGLSFFCVGHAPASVAKVPVVLALLFVAGCFTKPDPPGGPACSVFGPWSAPFRLPSTIDTTDDEGEPAISPDGKHLVFTRHGATNSLYVADVTGETFSAPTKVELGGDPNNAAWDPTGTQLYYIDGGSRPLLTMFDGHSFSAPSEHDQFNPLSPTIEGRPGFTADGSKLYYAANNAIYDATLNTSAQQYATGRMLDELGPGGYPVISSDGLEILFQGTVSGDNRLRTAHRTAGTAVFSTPESLSFQDAAGPTWTASGTMLLFAHHDNDFQLYYATRSCQ